MAKLQQLPAKVCLTAAGCLIHQDKVLLVKHKKVKAWLNPGGHLDHNELPHQAAEREFWEETGVKVKAFDLSPVRADDESEYLPSPFITNLHWVSKANYQARRASLKAGKKKYHREPAWSAGCEQHVGFVFLVKPVASVDFKENVEETDGIAWFAKDELKDLEIFGNIQQEVERAFDLVSGQAK